MKKLFGLATALAFSLFSCQQAPDGYQIEGEIEGSAQGMIYLKSFRNKMFFTVDSSTIENGKFSFSGKVEQPLLYGLVTEEMGHPAQFFLENKALKIKLNSEDEEIVSVDNSEVNHIFLENREKVFNEGFNIDSLVSKYPASPAAAFYLYRYFTYQLPLDSLRDTRSKLDESLEGSPYVKELDQIISRLENVQIGKEAPLFTLPDTTGTNVNLADFRGRYLLIDFWASWCPYCRVENPNLVTAYEKYKDMKFTILSVSLDHDHAKWMKAIHDDNMTWTHVSDLQYWDAEVPALYAVRGIPANVLLDPDGNIIARNLMGEELQTKLAELLP